MRAGVSRRGGRLAALPGTACRLIGGIMGKNGCLFNSAFLCVSAPSHGEVGNARRESPRLAERAARRGPGPAPGRARRRPRRFTGMAPAPGGSVANVRAASGL